MQIDRSNRTKSRIPGLNPFLVSLLTSAFAPSFLPTMAGSHDPVHNAPQDASNFPSESFLTSKGKERSFRRRRRGRRWIFVLQILRALFVRFSKCKTRIDPSNFFPLSLVRPLFFSQLRKNTVYTTNTMLRKFCACFFHRVLLGPRNFANHFSRLLLRPLSPSSLVFCPVCSLARLSIPFSPPPSFRVFVRANLEERRKIPDEN